MGTFMSFIYWAISPIELKMPEIREFFALSAGGKKLPFKIELALF